MLPGPGDFNFAISADKKGNTCIRALESNTASIVVAEMMGDGTYQVLPNEQVTFSDGKVSNAVPFGRCGCAPPQQTLKADAPKPAATYSINNVATRPPPIVAALPEKPPQPPPAEPIASAKPPLEDPAAAPASATKPGEVQVQVEIPMVYSADDHTVSTGTPAVGLSAAPAISPQPEPMYLPPAVYFALFRPVLDVPVVSPTPPADKPAKEKKGFFGRMKSFFGGIFK
jgi:hypothetical protein